LKIIIINKKTIMTTKEKRILELLKHGASYRDIQSYATRNKTLPKEVLEVIKRRQQDKNDLNTKLGVFGYSGRIPAKFFEGIVLDDDAFRQFYYMEYLGDHYDEVKVGPLGDWNSYTLKEFEELQKDLQ